MEAMIAWGVFGIAVLAIGAAMLEGYLRGREMRASVEGEERLH